MDKGRPQGNNGQLPRRQQKPGSCFCALPLVQSLLVPALHLRSRLALDGHLQRSQGPDNSCEGDSLIDWPHVSLNPPQNCSRPLSTLLETVEVENACVPLCCTAGCSCLVNYGVGRSHHPRKLSGFDCKATTSQMNDMRQCRCSG